MNFNITLERPVLDWREHYITDDRENGSVKCVFCRESASYDEIVPDSSEAYMALLGRIEHGCPNYRGSFEESAKSYIVNGYRGELVTTKITNKIQREIEVGSVSTDL